MAQLVTIDVLEESSEDHTIDPELFTVYSRVDSLEDGLVFCFTLKEGAYFE